MLIISATRHPLDYRFERSGSQESWTMGYLEKGCINTRTAEGRCVRAEGTVSLIPPYTAYSLEWGGGSGPWSELYSIFTPPSHWNHLLSWPIQEHGLGVLSIQHAPIKNEVESLLRDGMQLLRSGRFARFQLARNLMERVLILLDEINPLRGNQQIDLRVRQALDYISQHYADALNQDVLARHVCLSPSRFSHLFRSQMQVSPMQYVEQYRLERAAEKLLSSNQLIAQIAHEAGFSNQFHFSTRFKQHFNQAPSRYRLNPK